VEQESEEVGTRMHPGAEEGSRDEKAPLSIGKARTAGWQFHSIREQIPALLHINDLKIAQFNTIRLHIPSLVSCSLTSHANEFPFLRLSKAPYRWRQSFYGRIPTSSHETLPVSRPAFGRQTQARNVFMNAINFQALPGPLDALIVISDEALGSA
jgi:hypothetical protein